MENNKVYYSGPSVNPLTRQFQEFRNISVQGMVSEMKLEVYQFTVTIPIANSQLYDTKVYNLLADSFEQALREFAQRRPTHKIVKVELIDGTFLA